MTDSTDAELRAWLKEESDKMDDQFNNVLMPMLKGLGWDAAIEAMGEESS